MTSPTPEEVRALIERLCPPDPSRGSALANLTGAVEVLLERGVSSALAQYIHQAHADQDDARHALEALEVERARLFEQASLASQAHQKHRERAEKLQAQRDALAAALRLAHEWAASYPLQGSGSEADRAAATQVYAVAEQSLGSSRA